MRVFEVVKVDLAERHNGSDQRSRLRIPTLPEPLRTSTNHQIRGAYRGSIRMAGIYRLRGCDPRFHGLGDVASRARYIGASERYGLWGQRWAFGGALTGAHPDLFGQARPGRAQGAIHDIQQAGRFR